MHRDNLLTFYLLTKTKKPNNLGIRACSSDRDSITPEDASEGFSMELREFNKIKEGYARTLTP